MTIKSFLLLSDIHATDENPSSSTAPSYVSSYSAGSGDKGDPLSELRELMRVEGQQPDFLLCAGDITNRSSPQSLSFVWNKLNSLASGLGAKLISTVGNHDIDSRYQENQFDPRGYAMALAPTIPVSDRTNFLEYWAQHFTLIREASCNILVLNTAAYHGGGSSVQDELEHGRISAHTLSAIKATVASLPEASHNVLLCHHHPLRPEQLDSEFQGQTRGGAELVEALADTGDAWIIVHGHKHVPELYYGHGGGNSPVILGCASFSAQVNRDAQNKNPNQVHLLKLDPTAADTAGVSVAGEVLSWSWQPGVGWGRSVGRLGLPFRAGFGYRNPPRHLAREIENLLPEGPASISWKDALEALPHLQLVLPSDARSLEAILKDKGVVIARDGDGQPLQVGRFS